ncbi:hypothetical protein BDV93DRAFT_335996 [Ceratobasidium sp. AG-I]|nr:hypothetical protein BDV93DRAFT_335996 [Ceratobasidium sp. AG-I]
MRSGWFSSSLSFRWGRCSFKSHIIRCTRLVIVSLEIPQCSSRQPRVFRAAKRSQPVSTHLPSDINPRPPLSMI